MNNSEQLACRLTVSYPNDGHRALLNGEPAKFDFLIDRNWTAGLIIASLQFFSKLLVPFFKVFKTPHLSRLNLSDEADSKA